MDISPQPYYTSPNRDSAWDQIGSPTTVPSVLTKDRVRLLSNIFNIFTQYEIVDRINYFIINNTENNNIIIKKFLKILSIEYKKLKIRCVGYIINFIVKSIFFYNNLTDLKKELLNVSNNNCFRA